MRPQARRCRTCRRPGVNAFEGRRSFVLCDPCTDRLNARLALSRAECLSRARLGIPEAIAIAYDEGLIKPEVDWPLWIERFHQERDAK